MRTTALARLRSWFLGRPLPDVVIGVAAGCLTGVRRASKGKGATDRFILPLPPGAVVPTFDRRNLIDPGAVRAAVDEGTKALGVGAGAVSLLIPEPCVRVFIMTVDSLPASSEERESFIRWRVGKLMPLPYDDLRLDYAASPGERPVRVMACLGRRSVIQEYEQPLTEAGFKVGAVSVPALSLVNLLARETAAGGILLNIEEEYMSLLAMTGPGWSLYRQKGFAGFAGDAGAAESRVVQAAKEIENTVNFLEDKEGARVGKVWVRSGLLKEGPDILAGLREAQRLPVEQVVYDAPHGWNGREKAILAPLMGEAR